MLRSYKTEINPTEEQKTQIKQAIGTCRFLYNQFIAHNRELYEKFKNGLIPKGEKHFSTGYDFDKFVNNTLSKQAGMEWIKKCGSKARKKAIMNAHNAFQKFFAGKAGYPKFKKKSEQDVSIYFPKNNHGDWTVVRHMVKIPTLGMMRLKEFGYIPTNGKVISGTVSQNAGKFFVSVLMDVNWTTKKEKEALEKPFSDGIGIDLGVKELAVMSDGPFVRNINKSPRARKIRKKLHRVQRALSRKEEKLKKDREEAKKNGVTLEKRAHKNLDKNILQFQKLNQRLVNMRVDHENQMVAMVGKQKPRFVTIEDLNVRGMMKNRHLARAIAEQRLHSLREKLTAKAKRLGFELRVVGRFYPSSKLCSCCGHIKKDLKLKDRTYVCPSCGLEIDRDLNASINLRDAKEYTVA